MVMAAEGSGFSPLLLLLLLLIKNAPPDFPGGAFFMSSRDLRLKNAGFSHQLGSIH